MSDYRNLLVEMAEILGSGKQPLGYAMRTRIERALFITAKSIANSHLNQNISSFSLRAKETVGCLAKGKSGLKASRDVVLQAFELRADLSRLTSSDPYVVHDDRGEAIPGRRHAIAMFAKRLKRYSDELAAFLKREAQ